MTGRLGSRRLSDLNAYLQNVDREGAVRAEVKRLRAEIELSKRWAAERQESEARLRLLERELEMLRTSLNASRSDASHDRIYTDPSSGGKHKHSSQRDGWAEWEAELAEEDRLLQELSSLHPIERNALLSGQSASLNICRAQTHCAFLALTREGLHPEDLALIGDLANDIPSYANSSHQHHARVRPDGVRMFRTGSL